MPVLTDLYAEAAEVSIGDCFSIAKQLSQAFLAGQYDEIHLVYTNFVSVLSQTPQPLRLLPLTKPEQDDQGTRPGLILYEQDSEEVFAAIIPEYLGGIVYGALCESRAAEQAARRSAMDSATQNADDMIAGLSLKFNRARQAAGIVYGALCESRAAEQAARRSAMDSATQNADDMIAGLSLKFNRARQAAITQEITEIVAGS